MQKSAIPTLMSTAPNPIENSDTRPGELRSRSIWAVRRGQLDDLDTPAVRILHDEEDEQAGNTE